MRHLSLAAALIAGGFFFAAPAIAAPAPAATVVTRHHHHHHNHITLTDASGLGETNYPFQFGRPFIEGAIPHAPQVLINGVPAASQADVHNRYPDGSTEYAVMAVVIPSIPANGSVTLTFQDTASPSEPLTAAQMAALLPVGAASMTFTPASGAPSTIVDAAQMLLDGNCRPWTQGQTAQTMVCQDNSAARKYDVGFGDGYHPLRPAFYVTFWGGLNATSVRPEAETGLTTEVEDARYNVTVTAGTFTRTMEFDGLQATNPTIHRAATDWIVGPYWIGIAAPNPQVNIDNNLAYLESTRAVPNYDTTAANTPAGAITMVYNQWLYNPSGKLANTDPFHGYPGDGPTQMVTEVGDAGNNPWLGPAPLWDTLWIQHGDWRLRQVSLGVADNSGDYVSVMREIDPTRKFNRGDAAGTGLGEPVSIIGRPGLFNVIQGTATVAGRAFTKYNYNAPNVNDQLPLITALTNIDQGEAFGDPALDHLPDELFLPALLTGDPYYFNQMYMWMATQISQTYPNWPGLTVSAGGRGLDGTIGNVHDEWRGESWTARTLSETAWIAPDGSPEKVYFVTLMNDCIAVWEGMLGITGTQFDGSAAKLYGAKYGDQESALTNHAAPSLFQVQSFADSSINTELINDDILPPTSPATSQFFSPWMGEYFMDGIGRCAELGFACRALQNYTAQYFLGIIATNYKLLATYDIPTASNAGAPYTDWAQVIASMTNAYLTGTGFVQTGSAALPALWGNGGVGTRESWLQPGYAMMVDQGIPGASWGWWLANVYNPSGGGPAQAGDPIWSIVPRTDNNALPAQSTTP